MKAVHLIYAPDHKANHVILNRFLLFTLLLLFSIVTFCQNLKNPGRDEPKGFRAAVVKVDITPRDSQMLLGYQARKSTGVHDHIYNRIIILDDGKTQFFLVSSEICEFSPSQYDRIARLLKEQLGINPMNLWWATTHTHSAPELGLLLGFL